jgi:outer membrane protein OmpA-like peptidoglycan-associated protein
MRLYFGLVLLLCSAFSLPAGDLLAGVPLGDTFKIVEKHNFRKRAGGVYIGAAYREIRGVLRRASSFSGAWPPAGGIPCEGRFYVLEETKRDAREVSLGVDTSFPVKMVIRPDGTVSPDTLGRFPTMRNFPSFPDKPVSPGQKWQAFAERILDPDFSGAVTPVRVYVDYRYEGKGTYKGFEGSKITAKYAVRYKKGRDPAGDPKLEEVTGTHDVSIFLAAEPDGPRVISETFKEVYRYAGGRDVNLEGSVLTFYEGVLPLDRPGIAEDLRARIAGIGPAGTPKSEEPGPPPAAAFPPSSAVSSVPGTTPPAGSRPLAPLPPIAPRDLPDIEVTARPEGVALTINNLRFKPDSAEFLPEELSRLEGLAQVLGSVPGRTFLVVGHTADLGRPAGQKQLSVERARAVVESLVRRGVPRDRLIYEGRGAEEPAAPNTDEAGRAKNRRVEIIILED